MCIHTRRGRRVGRIAVRIKKEGEQKERNVTEKWNNETNKGTR